LKSRVTAALRGFFIGQAKSIKAWLGFKYAFPLMLGAYGLIATFRTPSERYFEGGLFAFDQTVGKMPSKKGRLGVALFLSKRCLVPASRFELLTPRV
jgi:hypothetical protein